MSFHRIGPLELVGLVASAALVFSSTSLAADDCWPRYAHDAALTGRTTLRGDIVSPREAWSLSLAGSQLEMELRPTPGQHTATLPGAPDAKLGERQLVAPGPALLDIDGSGTPQPIQESYSARWAHVLPGVAGWQQLQWDHLRSTDKISHLSLIAYDQGYDKPRTVWRSEPEDTVFSPLCVVYDIDDDGVQEICVALHYRVLIYEGTTGRKETELRFHTSRSYGWFGLADVDADGQMELVVLSDFQSHFDVLEYNPSLPEADRLSVKWRREIEWHIEDREKWPQIGPRPVVDVAGDPRPEIVVNLYNDTGDNQWHTLVLDANTGKTIADLPQRYTHGNADVDGDGQAEIFCTATEDVFLPEFGRVEIVDVETDQTSVLWSQQQAGFALADLPRLGPSWSTCAAQGMQQVLLSEHTPRPAFLVRTHDSLSAMRYEAGQGMQTLWTVEEMARDCETLALLKQGDSASALVRVRLPARTEAAVTAHGALPVVVGRETLGAGPFGPIATRSGVGAPLQIFVEGPGENVFAIRPPTRRDAQPEIAWQRPGRSMTGGMLSAADLDHDGSPEILAADRSPSGAAVLAAYRADGQRYWRHVFEHTPGARPVHNVGALTYWWPGHFRAADRVDLFVNTRRGLMHSAVGHLLDGRTGKTVWSHQKAMLPGVFKWGYAGFPVAVADLVVDERDELVNLYPVCYWVADGATGQLLMGKDLAIREVVPAWAAYGEPTVYDFNGDGQQEVLLDSQYILALLDATGQALWHSQRIPTGKADDTVGETTGTRHAVVDFDGDGRMEIASGGYKDGVRAIDPRDGTILWSLAAPAPTVSKCAAADIDGLCGDELLYVAGKTLLAVTGDRQSGRVLWTWQASSALSLPAIADVDDDGLAEILLQSADGVLHCLDGPQR